MPDASTSRSSGASKVKNTVLISGAGIAGPTLAYWLSRENFEVTVVERAPSLRLGGQNIDVSDSAVDVIKMMGIEPLVRAHNTTEEGLLFVNEKDEVQASLPKGTETSFTSEYEILRGDLGQILYDASKDKARYIFGDSVSKIDQTADAVAVEFASGAKGSYDLFVSADGVGSQTRPLFIDQPNPYKFLGVFTSYMTIPRRESDPKWARWYNAAKGRVFIVRPDNKGTTRASVNFVPHESYGVTDPAQTFTQPEVASILKKVLAGAGWESERIAEAIDQLSDIYLGPVSQIKLSTWSKGRCVLLGDAAYCPTPFTGMGTTLAIIGAYVLAGELRTQEKYEDAFRNFDRIMRPYVADVQKMVPGFTRIVYPETKTGARLFNLAAGFFAQPVIQKTIGWLGKLKSDSGAKAKRGGEFILPEYQFASVT